jgi:mono/diheme cytochrome c family protein
MRAAECLLAVCVLAAMAIADGPDDRDDVARGRQVFSKSCSNCHFVPDPTIERDRVWLGLIKTTA